MREPPTGYSLGAPQSPCTAPEPMHALQNSGNCTCLVVASSALLFRQLGRLLGCLLGGLLLLLARLLDGSLYALGGARSAALFLQLLLTALPLRLLFPHFASLPHLSWLGQVPQMTTLPAVMTNSTAAATTPAASP